jgi:hypothetical protein
MSRPDEVSDEDFNELGSDDIREILADESHAALDLHCIDLKADLEQFGQTALRIKRERDELAATLKDLVFGAELMLEPSMQLTGAFRAYVLEVKRVAEAVL